MQTTNRFSQARANLPRATALREQLSRGAQIGGELLAFGSLVLALATSVVALALIVGPA